MIGERQATRTGGMNIVGRTTFETHQLTVEGEMTQQLRCQMHNLWVIVVRGESLEVHQLAEVRSHHVGHRAKKELELHALVVHRGTQQVRFHQNRIE
mmetsp:Transcript_62726/g.97669  ORF Transcript_62726/g.97669 Transcript_62726/m.97669 type:complete len:97 (-) Transcript_62726:233-523(-)